MTAYLDQVAHQLLTLEADLRTALRQIRAGAMPARLVGWNTLRISLTEARTVLRGIMPVQIATSRLRPRQARLVAALALMRDHLVAMNDDRHRPAEAIGAAMVLTEELRQWVHEVRWRQACRRAGVKMRIEPLPVTAVMRLEEAEQTFRDRPIAAAGALEAQAKGFGKLPHQLRAQRAEQAELDLRMPAADVVQLVDHRQLHLQLPTKESRHAA